MHGGATTPSSLPEFHVRRSMVAGSRLGEEVRLELVATLVAASSSRRASSSAAIPSSRPDLAVGSRPSEEAPYSLRRGRPDLRDVRPPPMQLFLTSSCPPVAISPLLHPVGGKIAVVGRRGGRKARRRRWKARSQSVVGRRGGREARGGDGEARGQRWT
jgi:hypothetical protein